MLIDLVEFELIDLIDLVEFCYADMRIILKLSSVHDNYTDSTAEFGEINHLYKSSAGL